MRNKYFILVLTFLSLLIGQSGYAQDWDDMGWDDEITDFINDYEDQGGTVDYYDNAQDFLYDVNNDNDDSNDWEYGEFIDPRYEGTTQTDSQGNIYDYQYSEGWHPVDNSNNNNSDNDNSDNDNDDTDIYDGLLDTHNYDNDTNPYNDDQYPPGDNPDNDTNTPESPTTEEPPVKKVWYLDNDRDGYFASYVFAFYKPSGNYIANGEGWDCDDNDPSKKLGPDCGWKKWYLDADFDGYHSDETESFDSPGEGEGWVLTTKGVDCEESDPTITNQCWANTPSTCKGCPEVENELNKYESVIISANIVDPYTGLYPKSTDNSVIFLDANGNEPVPSIYALNPNFTLKSWQWYSTLGVYDSETFDKAALYCTTNLKADAFKDIGQRQAYYQWADAKVAKYSRWFGAAEIVTKWNAVGSAERLNLWYLNDAADKFLKEGNKFLFKFNLANAKTIVENGGLFGSFRDANGKVVVFDGLKNKALDYAMVKFEQTKVQDFINQSRYTKTPETMTSIMNSINFSMGSMLAPNEIIKVMKENFDPNKGQHPFNFSNYNDRVLLGQKLVDQLYK